MSTNPDAFETLELVNVARSFGGQTALRNLNLSIRKGEFIALLGPSGCGKSTALNCLAGLLPLTGGKILLDGKQIDQLPPEKRGFGMVFQNYALFPHLTVEKNVAFGLDMRNVPKKEIKERVAEAIELVQLGPHAKKLPGQMSGGQQQRVAIARALVAQPAIIWADEPTGNLDSEAAEGILVLLRRLNRERGQTFVIVTHAQDVGARTDRIVRMRDGQIVAQEVPLASTELTLR